MAVLGEGGMVRLSIVGKKTMGERCLKRRDGEIEHRGQRDQGEAVLGEGRMVRLSIMGKKTMERWIKGLC